MTTVGDQARGMPARSHVVHDPLCPCPACGYSLVGLSHQATPRCPECGHALEPADIRGEFLFPPHRNELLETCLPTAISAVAAMLFVVGWCCLGHDLWIGLAGVAGGSALVGAAGVVLQQVARLGVIQEIRSVPRRREHRRRAFQSLGVTVVCVLAAVLAVMGIALVISEWSR